MGRQGGQPKDEFEDVHIRRQSKSLGEEYNQQLIHGLSGNEQKR